MERKSLSAVDIHFLVQEWSSLEKGKIDGLFQYNNVFYIQIHLPNVGKKMLKVALPEFMFLTETKEDQSAASSFLALLRKYCLNARIKKIEQYKHERIVILTIETKESELKLIIELFSIGNMILCDQQDMIIGNLTSKKWSQREIKAKVKYEFPQSINAFALQQKEFEEVIKQSTKESLVKVLAIELGISGLYAEELCLRAKVDKNTSPKAIKNKELDELFRELKNLESISSTCVIHDEEGTIIDFAPFALEFYKDQNQQKSPSLNEAVAEFFAKRKPRKKENKYQGEIQKLRTIIELQEQNLQKLGVDIEEQKRKGDLIYEKYLTVKEILDSLQNARKKFTWKEIKEKLKGQKQVQDIDEKSGKLRIDL